MLIAPVLFLGRRDTCLRYVSPSAYKQKRDRK